jgi:hypothetical protein
MAATARAQQSAQGVQGYCFFHGFTCLLLLEQILPMA